MKLKMTKEGFAEVRDGKPLYILPDGTEQAIDGAAAMKLALNKYFEASPVMAGLKIPPDVAASFFGDAFRIEGGKLVALDGNGIQMYSKTRHGEAADFDDALAQLVERYPNKAMIQREPGGRSATPTGGTISRAQFDALPPDRRAKFFKEGGRIGGDMSSTPPVPATQKSNGKTITRAQFDVMPQAERAAHFQTGGKVVD